MCIEAIRLNQMLWDRVGGVGKAQREATAHFWVGSRQRFSLSRQIFLALCRDMVLCVAT